MAAEVDLRAGVRAEARSLRTGGQRLTEARRAEADEYALREIPAELHALWRKVRHRFRGPPDQRALSFLEWAERHPGDVEEALVARWDKMERDAERAYEAHLREAGPEDVPF